MQLSYIGWKYYNILMKWEGLRHQKSCVPNHLLCHLHIHEQSFTATVEAYRSTSANIFCKVDPVYYDINNKGGRQKNK